jgi:hypothetical protein
MRRLTLFISVALALLAFVLPATAGAKSHHKRHHHARLADRNHNGMPDRWEHRFRVHKAKADPDRDGVANLGEFHNGTNPRDADTDNDGVEDGDDDANHDGVDDGDEQSGVIDSFDPATGKLTIKLVNDDSFVGTVNADTEIECEGTTTAATRHDGESESGDDNSGSGSTNSGDDDATEHESGDDNSGPGSTNSGDDNDQGDDNDDQGENEDEHNCGTDALTQGTIVREAELRLTSGGAVFKEIELGGKAPA